MNNKLQAIINLIQQSDHLNAEEKAALLKSAKVADKELEITTSKLDHIEKVKKTMAILLEETIEELEKIRKDVEAQSRELEIESSLEKVRTVAMSMNKPDDMLDVCKTISQQLELLNVKEVRNVQTAIFYKEKGTYMNYEYYAKHNKTIITETSYTNNKIHLEFAEKMLKGPGEFMEAHINGDEVKAWAEYQKTTNVFIDDYLYTASSLNYYWFSLGSVALGISTYVPLSEEEINLFKRFLKVFELSYTRYLDIEKAGLQAREAQIELALERVRARTMAMQKSDELAETASVLFKQLLDLGIKKKQMRTCAIVTLRSNEPVGECWITTPDGNIIPQSFTVPYDETSAYKTIYVAWKNGEKFLVVHLSSDALIHHLSFLKKYANIPSQQFRSLPDEPAETYTHAMFFSQGYLFIISNEPLPEYHDIFKRFGKVFEQTYTRFLDLQKAEAQAREARIEAALEKVRSRSLAVHKSDEFKEVISVVFEKLQELRIPVESASINIFVDGSKDTDVYACGHTENGLDIRKVRLRYFDHPIANDLYNSHQNGLDFFVRTYDIKEKNSYYQYQFEHGDLKDLPAEIKERILQTERYSLSMAPTKNSIIIINNFDGKTLSDIEIDIQKRFANVFDQAYTRFLDLQKAEAQSREAQIQLALERVRARTMAMQHSDELPDAANILFQQMQTLAMPAWSAGYCIWDDDHQAITLWMSSAGIIQKPFRAPVTDDPSFIHFYDAWKRGETFYVEEIGGDAIVSHYQYMLQLPVVGEMLKQFIADGGSLPAFQIFHLAFFSQGFLLFITYEQVPEAHEIFKRFGKVFEQTYTRFLDLQKAESQARESQIQLALERVRARTMAMQHSDELKDAAALLFQQVKSLGAPAYSCGYNIWEKDEKEFTSWMSTQDGSIINGVPNIPLTEDANFIRYVESKKNGEQFFVLELRGERMQEHYQYLKTIPAFKGYFDYAVSVGFDLPKTQIHHVANFSQGNLLFITLEPCPEFHGVFKRFAAVFEQTYTRFLDLQKAEAQSRESQIELGLERVRARAMAMQKSGELSELVDTVFKELTKLDFALTWCIINIIDESSLSNTVWAANPDIDKAPESYYMKFEDYPFHHAMMKGWKERKLKDVYILEGQEKKIYDKYLFNETEFRRVPAAAQAASRAMEQYVVTFSFSNFGGLQTVGDVTLSDANLDILGRFGKVFDLTYTRFNDLKQAEAQARESQIQLALERVRARTMAMQKSDELSDAVYILFQQFKELGEKPDQATIGVINEDEKVIEYWVTMYGKPINKVFKFSFDEPNVTGKIYKAWKENKKSLMIDLIGDALTEFMTYRAGKGGAAINPDEKRRIINVAFFSKGLLNVQSNKERSEESIKLLERFASVFEQTYTRFNDLKQAEAQAKEAQIEAALERVRSRSMGMQKSEELKDVIQIVYEQFVHLNINVEHTGFIMDYKERNDMHIWLADKHEVPFQVTIPYFDCAHWNSYNEAKEKGIDFFTNHLSFEEKNKFYQDLFKLFPVPDDAKEYYSNCPGLAISTVLLDNVGLYIENFSGTPYSDEDNKTLMRFGKVFQQTYTRFLDLQKAEAQAKEAQIEAALERVRSRTMAMRNSDELAELVATVFTELNRLEFALTSCIIWINNPELLTAEMWVASTDLNKPPEPYYIKPFRHPYFKSVINAFKEKNKKWVYQMNEKEKKVFQEQFFDEVGSFPTLIKKALEAPQSVVYSASFYNFGALEIVGTEHLTDEKFEILHRLGKVFDMSYTRFNDLKQAEAQAREARIEAALERVRSRTLAMQKSDELAETAAVLFSQLIYLGIAPNRLYIGIIHDDTGYIEAWATDEEGGKINNRFTLSRKRNASVKKMYDAWKRQERSITIDMQGEELTDYISYLSGEIHLPVTTGHKQQRRVQNIAYFGKGFIGIASPDPQPQETIQLIERFAAVFNLTYTRFNDLKVAEAHAIQTAEDLIKLQTEKKRAEDALAELQVTQRQLIQSEKMASLGELTAGIAHEIQNPLNFVNNFSEVSTELVDEMNDEINKGNLEDAKQIAEDLKQNLEKINHHGKRAGDIVKGMLQHSRSSSGAKEPTNINTLADEYLRLAYHGLRAKDKAFNANMQTDFDETIENINIIPQDIGRVILNLITNAFYAVNEKAKNLRSLKNSEEYEPNVSVITKVVKFPSGSSEVLLTVKDNGNGIPKKVLDKIFQPFFTTKPTGEGTGLGLSLSYDIIKAHGGEIKVETKESEGSEFIIALPVI